MANFLFLLFQLISLIDQARESATSNTQVVQLLDKVEDILRYSELYSPHVKEDNRMKADEPVVTDLITALLSVSILKHWFSSKYIIAFIYRGHHIQRTRPLQDEAATIRQCTDLLGEDLLRYVLLVMLDETVCF